MSEITITATNFEQEVMQSTVPVLVDFWADWCGPCKMLAPAVAQLAEDMEGKAKVGKVNVDQELSLAAKFGIEAIPTLLVFKNGQLTAKHVGLCSSDELETMLK